MLGLVDQIPMDQMTFFTANGEHTLACHSSPCRPLGTKDDAFTKGTPDACRSFPWSTGSPKEGGRRYLHLPLSPQRFLSALAFCSTKLSYSLMCLAIRYFVSRARLYTTWLHTYICHLALVPLSYLRRCT